MIGRLIHIAVHRGKLECEERSEDLTLLLVLEGNITVTINGATHTLGPEDMLAIDARTPYTLRSLAALCAVFTLDADGLRACFGGRRFRFRCDTTGEVSDNYLPLRRLLAQVLQA